MLSVLFKGVHIQMKSLLLKQCASLLLVVFCVLLFPFYVVILSVFPHLLVHKNNIQFELRLIFHWSKFTGTKFSV